MAQRKAHKLKDKERTCDIQIEENVDFDGMFLSAPVLLGLKNAGFEKPSPIQLASIPLGRCGLDLVVQAKSGTGKTCVFTVVALEMVSVASPTTQVLVLAPTREIAVQITQVITAVGSGMPKLRVSTFIGGISLAQDKAKLRCCHIAVGTPGRITQLVELGFLKLNNARLFVLDEADQLLAGQFSESVINIASGLPLNKQVLALSATYTDEVALVAEKLMRSPNHVRLGRESPALLGLNQFVRLLPHHHQLYRRQKTKFTELLAILSTVTFNQCLVFTNSQLRAESICNELKASGWPTTYLTGAQKQCHRLEALDALCSYKCRVLVSTDLSARGLDSEHVNLVVNLDLPHNQATYLHRVGRAGRFGSRGAAITLVTEGEEWLNLRALVTLVNVKVKLLKEEWDCGLAIQEVKEMEEVSYLSDEELESWMQGNNSHNYYEKANTKKMVHQSDIKDGRRNNSSEKFEKGKKGENPVAANNSKKIKKTLKRESTVKTMNSPSQSMTEKQVEPSVRSKESTVIEEEITIDNEEDQRKVELLLSSLIPKPITTNTTYTDVLAECTEKYDKIMAEDTPVIRIPPLPNKLELKEEDLKIFARNRKAKFLEQRVRVNNRKADLNGFNIDFMKALQAVIEGRDAVSDLNQDSEVSSLKERQGINENNFEAIGSQQAYKMFRKEICRGHGRLNETAESESSLSSCKSDSEGAAAPKPTMESDSSTASSQAARKQNYSSHKNTSNNIRKNRNLYQFSERQSKNYVSECEDTGTWQAKKKAVNKGSRKAQTSGAQQSVRQGGAEYQDWYSTHNHQMDNDHAYMYSAQPWDMGAGSMGDGEPQAQHHHQDQWRGSAPSGGGWGSRPDAAWHLPQDSTAWMHRSYIDSAYKFASMMDYVRTMGKMSAWIAYDYHSRNKGSDC